MTARPTVCQPERSGPSPSAVRPFGPQTALVLGCIARSPNTEIVADALEQYGIVADAMHVRLARSLRASIVVVCLCALVDPATSRADDAGAARYDATLDSASPDGDAGARADAAIDASGRCAEGSVVVDREEHCCRPGQSWLNGRCQGAVTSCPPGESRDPRRGCVRREGERSDAGLTQRLEAAPRVVLPPSMVLIPGATFRSGGQWVSVGAFAIDRTEVTAAAYARCVAAGVCAAAPDPYGSASLTVPSPVTGVSWSMASRYCGWAGGRLPTETEWELASRGLEGRRFPWGERAPDCALARFAGCGDAPLRVGALAAGASPFGLLDTAGNVAEWVHDVFGPRGGRDDGRVMADPTGPLAGERRVVRGGSFVSNPAELTCEARRGVDAREQRSDLGFRCARGL